MMMDFLRFCSRIALRQNSYWKLRKRPFLIFTIIGNITLLKVIFDILLKFSADIYIHPT